MMKTLVIGWALSTVIRLVSEVCARTMRPYNQQRLTTAKNYVCAALQALACDRGTRDVLVHETGHAIAATLLFKDAQPSISLFGAQGGVCKYAIHKESLTFLGRSVKYIPARALIAAAGPLASLVSSIAFIITAHSLSNQYREVKAHLNVMAVCSIFGHAMYAQSALDRIMSAGHDFFQIWYFAHIHPMTSLLFLVAVPILIKAGLEMRSYFRQQEVAPLLPQSGERQPLLLS